MVDELILKIEAILFSYGDWISAREIKDILDVDDINLIKKNLEKLFEKYKEGFSFKVVKETGNRYKMMLDEKFEPIVEKLISGIEIPKNVLKVLSVIAYEQPITKTRLAEILGRYVKEEINFLYKNKFINYEKKGIGKYYKVTKKFYDYFNIEEDFRNKANEKLNVKLTSEEEILKELENKENGKIETIKNKEE